MHQIKFDKVYSTTLCLNDVSQSNNVYSSLLADELTLCASEYSLLNVQCTSLFTHTKPFVWVCVCVDNFLSLFHFLPHIVRFVSRPGVLLCMFTNARIVYLLIPKPASNNPTIKHSRHRHHTQTFHRYTFIYMYIFFWLNF